MDTWIETPKYPTLAHADPDMDALDPMEHWIVVCEEQGGGKHLRRLPHGEFLWSRWRLRNDGKQAPRKDTRKVCVADLPNPCGAHVSFLFLPADVDSFQLLTWARKSVAAHRDFRPRRIALVFSGYAPADADRFAEAWLSAALASHSALPQWKKEKPRGSRLRKILLCGASARESWKQGLAEAEGNALARGLSALPGNVLTPGKYRRHLERMSKEHGWSMDCYGMEELARRNAGAFLAVAQGSPDKDAAIVRLRYRPLLKTSPIALVGKGICYDTGGVNLKPAQYMYGMHEDMQGSAVALGTLLALTRLKYKRPVECWLALASNHIGSRAYKPNDVVVAMNGVSIEIVHTDAEGRMVLADTLAMASASKPALIMDYATLTGACVQAIGKSYSGVLTNRPGWWQDLISLGAACGERVWPFPLDEDYDQELRSEVADVKQCSLRGEADHILAARFLRRFVGKGIPWLHFDLSSSRRKGGLAHVSTATTGFGVRYGVRLLTGGNLENLLGKSPDNGHN